MESRGLEGDCVFFFFEDPKATYLTERFEETKKLEVESLKAESLERENF